MYDADDVKHGPAGAGPQATPSPQPATRLKAERVQLALRAEGLECRLSTPAADGVTEQDLELAKELSLLG